MRLSELIFRALTYNVRNNHITTLSGQRMYVFRPDDPRNGQIRVADFAHSMSFLCRWGGNLQHFYSVGQHSVYAYKLATLRRQPWVVRFMGLFHEIGEPIMADMPSPVKAAFPMYRWTEDRFQTRAFISLADRAGYPMTAAKVRSLYPVIKGIDKELLQAERVTLRGRMSTICSEDGRVIPSRPGDAGLNSLVDPDFHYWSFEKAEEEFINAARELGLHY